jgi:rRNA maturation protein Rpf1
MIAKPGWPSRCKITIVHSIHEAEDIIKSSASSSKSTKRSLSLAEENCEHGGRVDDHVIQLRLMWEPVFVVTQDFIGGAIVEHRQRVNTSKQRRHPRAESAPTFPRFDSRQFRLERALNCSRQ